MDNNIEVNPIQKNIRNGKVLEKASLAREILLRYLASPLKPYARQHDIFSLSLSYWSIRWSNEKNLASKWEFLTLVSVGARVFSSHCRRRVGVGVHVLTLQSNGAETNNVTYRNYGIVGGKYIMPLTLKVTTINFCDRFRLSV